MIKLFPSLRFYVISMSMFFYLSKILAFLLEPALHPLYIIAIGVLWRRDGSSRFVRQRNKTAKRIIVFGAILPLIYGFLPFGQLVVRQIEYHQPATLSTGIDADAIIVLGGYSPSGRIPATRNQGQLSAAGERLIAGISFAQAYPNKFVLFSGGSGAIHATGWGEADSAKALMSDMGLSFNNIVFETQSRNTHENATKTHALINPHPDGKYVLVTSAIHMPRSLGTFRAAGWPDMTPYPVDYLSPASGVDFAFHMEKGLMLWRHAYHEITGIIVYWLTGRYQP